MCLACAGPSTNFPFTHVTCSILFCTGTRAQCCVHIITEGENMRLSGSIYPVVLLLLAAFAFSVPTGKLISHFVCVCVCARARRYYSILSFIFE